ncbi:MAG: LysM peptidoglycan-binding domain-containing protein [Chloroflexi bacterium]|nr:LysM peptidoglycan-binding domain-containing protein [Chloroflexota bacterium]MBU1746260.1 LysM peptidoglycan-binding domain-containing protein [Chloroflexota bacterium]
MRCPTCGTDNPAQAQVCEECEARLIAAPARKVRRCPECGARMGQWDTSCAVCNAQVDVVPVPRIPLPASALVGGMALLLLLFAAWSYQPWTLLAMAPPTLTPTSSPRPERTATPTPLVTPTALPITVTHVVQPGETLMSIAQQYGTTVEAIMQANQLTSLVLVGGQVLRVPVPPAGAPTPTPRRNSVVHVVQPGEFLEIIAERYGVSVRAIMDANDLSSDLIYPGQKLVIPVPGARSS